MLLELVPDLKIRLAHFDEGLGISAPSYHAPIVVAQHDDWRTSQVGPKHSLAGGVERIAVDQCEDWLKRGHDSAR